MGEYIFKAVGMLFFFGFTLIFCKLIEGSEKDSEFERAYYHDPNVNIFMAEIIQRFHKDTTYYVVTFNDGGKLIEARTVLYKQVKGKYIEGDTVPVKYYITEGGDARAMIMDDELLFSRGNSNVSKIAYIVNRGCLILAIYFIIRAFVG